MPEIMSSPSHNTYKRRVDMKQLLVLLTLFVCSPLVLACDETCKRTKAETDNNIKFASYLNAKYCATTTKGFMLQEIKSLQSYREKQLATAHRGGAKNIRHFVTQRKEWLSECDKYLELTGQGRVFYDKDTTVKILGTMDTVADELKKIMSRPQNPAENLDLVITPAAAQFDLLFDQLEEHKLLMQRKGQL
jgi:hypothetical protein